MRHLSKYFGLLALFVSLLIVSESQVANRDSNRTGATVDSAVNEEWFGSGKTHPLTITFASRVYQFFSSLVHVAPAPEASWMLLIATGFVVLGYH